MEEHWDGEWITEMGERQDVERQDGGAAGMQEHRDGGSARHKPISNPSITKAADGITGAGHGDGWALWCVVRC